MRCFFIPRDHLAQPSGKLPHLFNPFIIWIIIAVIVGPVSIKSKLSLFLLQIVKPVQPPLPWCAWPVTQLNIRVGSSEDCARFSSAARAVIAKCEQLKQIVRLKKPPLLRVFQHPICQKLLEYLPVKQNIIIYIQLSCQNQLQQTINSKHAQTTFIWRDNSFPLFRLKEHTKSHSMWWITVSRNAVSFIFCPQLM